MSFAVLPTPSESRSTVVSTPRIDAVLDRFHKALDKEDMTQNDGESTPVSNDAVRIDAESTTEEVIQDDVRIRRHGHVQAVTQPPFAFYKWPIILWIFLVLVFYTV